MVPTSAPLDWSRAGFLLSGTIGNHVVMASPQEAQEEIMDALYDHFDRTAAHLTPRQISEMTALPIDSVKNALRVLYRANRIEGIPAAEFDYPLEVTGIVYE